MQFKDGDRVQFISPDKAWPSWEYEMYNYVGNYGYVMATDTEDETVFVEFDDDTGYWLRPISLRLVRAEADIDRDLAPAKAGKDGHRGSPGNEDSHYTGSVQPIDLIDSLTLEGLIGAHEAAVIKYVSRWRKKGGLEDLNKAKWWLDRLIALAGSLL